MQPDNDKIDDTVLALLALDIHDETKQGARSWKGHNWEALNRLHQKGWINDPVTKAKSVILTPEGLARSRNLFKQLFTKETLS